MFMGEAQIFKFTDALIWNQAESPKVHAPIILFSFHIICPRVDI